MQIDFKIQFLILNSLHPSHEFDNVGDFIKCFRKLLSIFYFYLF